MGASKVRLISSCRELTDRQTGRQADRQTGRQAGRHTYRVERRKEGAGRREDSSSQQQHRLVCCCHRRMPAGQPAIAHSQHRDSKIRQQASPNIPLKLPIALQEACYQTSKRIKTCEIKVVSQSHSNATHARRQIDRHTASHRT